MKGWLIFLALCAFAWSIVYVSTLLHNISPSLRVVESKERMSNVEVEKRGYTVSANRKYFRKVTYKERKQTDWFIVRVTRDTIDSHIYYTQDE